MTKYKKLINNTMIFALGNIGSKIITFLMLPFYTGFLTTEQYGKIDLVNAILSLFIPLISLNIGEAILRFTISSKDDKKVLNNGLAVSVLGYILGVFILRCILKSVGYDLYIVYVILFIKLIHVVLKQYIRAIGKTNIYVISDIVNTLTFVILNIIFIGILHIGIDGYFYSLCIAYSVDVLIQAITIKVDKQLDLKLLDIELIKSMSKFSLPLLPNSVMLWIIGTSDRFILNHMIGLGAIGIYSIANKFPSLLNIMNSIFFKAWQMSAIEQYDDEDREQFYSNIFDIYSSLMLIASAFMIIVIKFIMKIIVNKEFYIAWKYTPLLFISIVFGCFSNFFSSIFIASKDTKLIFNSSLIGALTNILLNCILIPKIGIQGACIATFISYIIMFAIRVKDSRKIIKFSINIQKIFTSCLIIIIQIIILMLINNNYYLLLMQLACFSIIIFINYKQLDKILEKVNQNNKKLIGKRG